MVIFKRMQPTHPNVLERQCRACGETKPLDDFARDPNSRGGRHQRCKRCVASKRRASVAKLRAAGCCVDCGGPQRHAGAPKCERCHERHKTHVAALRRRRIDAGLCSSAGCPAPQVPGGTRCTRCALKAIVRLNLGGARTPDELLRLFAEQSGRCALTGRALTIGVNASIDHVHQKSNGGGHELSNLRWVLTAANIARAKMTDDEFIAMCRDVVAHAARE